MDNYMLFQYLKLIKKVKRDQVIKLLQYKMFRRA